MQAQQHGGTAGQDIGRGRPVVDAADFAGAVTDLQGAGRLIVEGAEVDLELAFEQQVQVLIALVELQEDLPSLQIAGAKALEQKPHVAGADVMKQAKEHDLMQVDLPLADLHGHKTRNRRAIITDIANAPCRFGIYRENTRPAGNI